MNKKSVDPKARKALNQMKTEMASEHGMTIDEFIKSKNKSPKPKIYSSGHEGGIDTRQRLRMEGKDVLKDE